MEMKNEILTEIKQLKSIVAKLIGSSESPEKERFSIEAIEKAAKEFQIINIQRDEWIDSEKIEKYFKGARWGTGKFIIQEFEFTNFFKKGRDIYYNKKDIIALAKELKDRNVDLARYMELSADKANFRKKVEAIILNENKNPKKKNFKLPKDAKDITTSPAPKPDIELIRADLKRLKKDFFENKLNEYIDIYGGNHAMSKDMYRFYRYMDPILIKKIQKWCADFNHANRVLLELTKKKDIFVPVPENEIIKL